ncbi:MAG: hypothetical protein ACKPCM_02800, partial [Pseudanabaena sp.]
MITKDLIKITNRSLAKKATNNKRVGWYGIENNRDFMFASCHEISTQQESFGLERKFGESWMSSPAALSASLVQIVNIE